MCHYHLLSHKLQKTYRKCTLASQQIHIRWLQNDLSSSGKGGGAEILQKGRTGREEEETHIIHVWTVVVTLRCECSSDNLLCPLSALITFMNRHAGSLMEEKLNFGRETDLWPWG